MAKGSMKATRSVNKTKTWLKNYLPIKRALKAAGDLGSITKFT